MRNCGPEMNTSACSGPNTATCTSSAQRPPRAMAERLDEVFEELDEDSDMAAAVLEDEDEDQLASTVEDEEVETDRLDEEDSEEADRLDDEDSEEEDSL